MLKKKKKGMALVISRALQISESKAEVRFKNYRPFLITAEAK